MTTPHTTSQEALYEFMPYGAPELKEVARRYMARALAVAAGIWTLLYLIFFGTGVVLRSRPHETKVIIVPYRELAAPPPLTDKPPPPQVQVQAQVAPPAAAIPVPVPDAQAPPEQTIQSQEEIAQATPSAEPAGDQIQVAPPSDGDAMPKFGEYVFTDELPEVVSKTPVEYPDIARSANVEGLVTVWALVGKDGKVKETRIAKSVPMLDAAAESAVKQYVFKPALSNNKPVAVWVAVPVRFSLH
jgi:periplasmic protein TonB